MTAVIAPALSQLAAIIFSQLLFLYTGIGIEKLLRESHGPDIDANGLRYSTGLVTTDGSVLPPPTSTTNSPFCLRRSPC